MNDITWSENAEEQWGWACCPAGNVKQCDVLLNASSPVQSACRLLLMHQHPPAESTPSNLWACGSVISEGSGSTTCVSREAASATATVRPVKHHCKGIQYRLCQTRMLWYTI